MPGVALVQPLVRQDLQLLVAIAPAHSCGHADLKTLMLDDDRPTSGSSS